MLYSPIIFELWWRTGLKLCRTVIQLQIKMTWQVCQKEIKKWWRNKNISCSKIIFHIRRVNYHCIIMGTNTRLSLWRSTSCTELIKFIHMPLSSLICPDQCKQRGFYSHAECTHIKHDRVHGTLDEMCLCTFIAHSLNIIFTIKINSCFIWPWWHW